MQIFDPVVSGSLIISGSQTIIGTQTISGSVVVSGSITLNNQLIPPNIATKGFAIAMAASL